MSVHTITTSPSPLLMEYLHKEAQEQGHKTVDNYILSLLALKSSTTTNNNQYRHHSRQRARRRRMPSCIRSIVWNRYVGLHNQYGYCFVCREELVTKRNFHVSHVVSVANGGNDHIDNLRVCCSNCNESIGSENMKTFMQRYNLPIITLQHQQQQQQTATTAETNDESKKRNIKPIQKKMKKRKSSKPVNGRSPYFL